MNRLVLNSILLAVIHEYSRRLRIVQEHKERLKEKQRLYYTRIGHPLYRS